MMCRRRGSRTGGDGLIEDQFPTDAKSAQIETAAYAPVFCQISSNRHVKFVRRRFSVTKRAFPHQFLKAASGVSADDQLGCGLRKCGRLRGNTTVTMRNGRRRSAQGNYGAIAWTRDRQIELESLRRN